MDPLPAASPPTSAKVLSSFHGLSPVTLRSVLPPAIYVSGSLESSKYSLLTNCYSTYVQVSPIEYGRLSICQLSLEGASKSSSGIWLVAASRKKANGMVRHKKCTVLECHELLHLVGKDCSPIIHHTLYDAIHEYNLRKCYI